MNRGPVKGSRPSGLSFMDKVYAAHGQPADWLLELARLADAEGLVGAERLIGYSRSAISTVLSGKYKGDIDRVEEMVRGALMSETVECPVLGDLPRNRCLDWQKKPYVPTSSHRVQMYVACQHCIHARRNKVEADA